MYLFKVNFKLFLDLYKIVNLCDSIIKLKPIDRKAQGYYSI